MNKIPVIIDTDIGTDIDDTWALALALKSPELDIRLVTAVSDDTWYRAALAAKLLEIAGRADIPVGMGPKTGAKKELQEQWLTNYDLAKYPGMIHHDGVQALIETVMQAPGPVTLITLGPLTNIAAALAREPRIAGRANIVGMLGCVGQDQVHGDTCLIYSRQGDAEYNVCRDVGACQQVFTAPWDITLAPLDTGALIRLEGERYRAVERSRAPLARAVMENYRIWLGGRNDGGRSSRLYDTLAVYLAFSRKFVGLADVALGIDDRGHLLENPGGRLTHCALDWISKDGFLDFLVARLA